MKIQLFFKSKLLLFIVAIPVVSYLLIGAINVVNSDSARIFGLQKSAERENEETGGMLVDSSNIPQEVEDITIIIGGDSWFAGSVGKSIVEKNYNSLQYMQGTFDEFDLVVLNLETNISNPGTGSPQNKNYAFNAPVKAIQILKNAGVDLVSLANNHTNDYGPNALVEQIKLLKESEIASFGAGKNIEEAFAPKYLMEKGNTVAFIGVNEIETYFQNATNYRAGSAYFDDSLLRNSIEVARKNADVVIIYAHWGVEHSTQQNYSQQAWAKKFIDYGADLVVGSHPHVRQGHEMYKGKHIYYSLGNFVFSGMAWNPEAIIGSALTIDITNKEISNTDLLTVELDYFGRPKRVKD